MNAERPPKITATRMIAPALACGAVMIPKTRPQTTTKTKPRRNIVAVIRTVRPRSGAYLVCVAITHLRFSQARDLSGFVALCLVVNGNLSQQRCELAEAFRCNP